MLLLESLRSALLASGAAGKPRVRQGTRTALTSAVESLEGRRMLSVSATTLAGPTTTAGVTWDYELLGGTTGTTILETNTQRVISATELDSTGSMPGGKEISTSKNYDSLGSSGLIGKSSTGANYGVGGTVNLSTTYLPPEVILPGTMTAGTTYKESTTSTTTESGAVSASIVTSIMTTLNLEKAMQSITVPAGKYNSYVIDETIKTTSVTTITGQKPVTSGPITNSGKAYYAPGVGLVELAIGAGKTELTAYVNAAAWALSGKITGTLPTTSLKSGQKTSIAEKLTLTNTGKTSDKGTLQVRYYLSPYTTVESNSILLPGGGATSVNLSAGGSTVLNLSITTIPSATPSGTYYIVAEVTDPSGSIRDFASAGTIKIIHM